MAETVRGRAIGLAGRVVSAVRRRPVAFLYFLLVPSQVLYVALLRWNAVNGWRPVLGFLALMAGLFALYGLAFRALRGVRDRDREVLAVVLLGAVLFRVTMLGAGLPHDATAPELLDLARADLRGEALVYERFLLYDHDLWRYLWDGHVAANGVNPYAFAPQDSALDVLAEDGVWPEVRENINHPQLPTLYPPLAQLVFQASHAVAPGSVLALKALLVALDLGATLLVAGALRASGRPLSWVVLYAWNPLLIKAVAGSGHFDSMVAGLLAALVLLVVQRRKTLAALVFALAVLARLTPLVLVPVVARRLGWRRTALAAAVIVAGYLPFLDAGAGLGSGLAAFSREWHFNAGLYALAENLFAGFTADPAGAARAVCALAITGALLYLAARDDGKPETFAVNAAAALGALIVFSPTVFPWYVVWVLPLAVIARSLSWIWFSALVCLAFLVMVEGREYPAALVAEYGAFLWLAWRHSKARQAAGAPGRIPLLAEVRT
ncbi:MAG: hypothetical protein L0212_12685 [Acidobacteria bacterium]|nr:hypothetical protein [Acidobacteriota bacterium]